MVTIPVDCVYYEKCAGKSVTNCRKCKNNRIRNKEINYFEQANDNPIPEKNPRVTYSGPAEHTAGYKCPVCGEHTNPYALHDNRCGACGFKLNIV
jgi:DNA-directed RNA polymerase subunit RPC12/RpoP